MSLQEARQRVARGCAWFDDVLPDWAEFIDPVRFDIADSRWCAFGQNAAALVPRHYAEALVESTPPNEECPPLDYHDVLDSRNLSDEWAFEHGFAPAPTLIVYSTRQLVSLARDHGYVARCQVLQQAWLEVIHERQQGTDDAYVASLAGPLVGAGA